MACARVASYLTDHQLCSRYEASANFSLPWRCASPVVPPVYHAISGGQIPYVVRATSLANPGYRFNYHTDETALRYVEERCGTKFKDTLACLAPPAYRADLFRFCAIYAEGGVYLDADIVPLHPLGDLYEPCATLTVGADIPQGDLPGAQMKILAGRPGNRVAKCMLDRIHSHVAWRYVPPNSLSVSGPLLLAECVRNHSNDVAYTYMDTREAGWPYTGMRTRDKLLAFERPNEKRSWKGADKGDYAALHKAGKVYTETCKVERVALPSYLATPPSPPAGNLLSVFVGFGTVQPWVPRLSVKGWFRKRRLDARQGKKANHPQERGWKGPEWSD